jgi:hypothetical protein
METGTHLEDYCSPLVRGDDNSDSVAALHVIENSLLQMYLKVTQTEIWVG